MQTWSGTHRKHCIPHCDIIAKENHLASYHRYYKGKYPMDAKGKPKL
jgi:hypothetical protein